MARVNEGRLPFRWFAASVTHLDDGIGKIVNALDTAGLRKDTILVFVSDNGGQESWESDTQYEGNYAKLPHTVLGNNLPLQGWKGDCYEGGIRVPGFVNWPSSLSAGKIDAPVHIVDWMPTLCHLAGCAPMQNIDWDGQNIWQIITGKADQIPERPLYWKTSRSLALRKGDWKLIISRQDGQSELFNIKNDPFEKNDLASQETELVLELKTAMKQIASSDREKKS